MSKCAGCGQIAYFPITLRGQTWCSSSAWSALDGETITTDRPSQSPQERSAGSEDVR